MLKQFKRWVYNFVVGGLFTDKIFIDFVKQEVLRDEQFIKNLLVILENEKKRQEFERWENEQKKRAAVALLLKQQIQDKCSHLKGGNVLRGPLVDYNIWIHTFPDNTRTVRCLTCSKEWKGEQLKSEEVRNMIQRTTNTPSSSETTVGKTPDRDPKAVFYDELKWEKEPPKRDLEIAKESIMANIVRRMKQLRLYNKIRQGL